VVFLPHSSHSRVTLQLTVGQSVHLGVEPLRYSWPDFGCC